MMLLRHWLRRSCAATAASNEWLLRHCRFPTARAPQADAQEKLNELLNEYDRASGEDERARVAEETYQIIGEKIAAMVRRANRSGRPLDDDQVRSLAMLAPHRGLQESGMTAFRRISVEGSDWSDVVRRCQRAENVPASGHPGGPGPMADTAGAAGPRLPARGR
jgi:hypothetical protein